MRHLVGVACLFLLFVPSGQSNTMRDLDVGVPPGSPIEWDKNLRQPVPTGGRGRVPVSTTDQKPTDKLTDKPADKPGHGGGNTVAEMRDPKPAFNYGSTNLYDFFRVKTVDIMLHVKFSLPKGSGKVTQEEYGDVATGNGGGGGGPSKVTWNYPPEIPVELAWMSMMACIRTDIHPEVLSDAESIIYCVELGIPGHYGSKGYPGKIGNLVEKLTQPLPAQPPNLVGGKNLYEQMIARLAVVELSSGFAYALDPNFARRTLALGEDAYRPILDCVKSKHPLLSENAVAVLCNFQNPDVAAELKRIFEWNTDPVCRFRALTGLLRLQDVSIVPNLISMVKGGEEHLRCYAMYALGVLGDAKASAVLRQIIQIAGIKNKELLWSALPAVARIGDKSRENLELIRQVEKTLRAEFTGSDKVEMETIVGRQTPTAEKPGSKAKILRQMALLALAAQGDAGAVKEVLDRMDKEGLATFHQALSYLASDVLIGLGEAGAKHVKAIADSRNDDPIRVHALRVLGRAGKADSVYLKEKATTDSPVLQATAILMLANVDEKSCAEVCRSIVAKYAASAGAIDGAEAFLTATAAQAGGKAKAWTDATAVANLIKAVERAYANGAYGQREGDNNPDIVKSKISIYPPLLETLLIELGRTGSEKALPVLLKILKTVEKTPGRAEAALSLGGIGGKEAVDALLVSVVDKDAWVRFCSYLSLKRLSGQDYFCDWLFGGESTIKIMGEKYVDWFKKNQAK